MPSPNRQTSEQQLNEFNIWMRSQPWFQQWHQQRGLNPSGNGNRKLSRAEQSELENLMRQNGVNLDGGMHIDSGGSLNQKNRLGRNIAIGAAATGAALTGFGLAGMGPLSGLGGAAGVGAGGTGAGLNAAGTFAAGAGAPGAAGGLGVTAGTLGGATAAGSGAAALPTLGSTPIGSGMGAAPSVGGASAGGGSFLNTLQNGSRTAGRIDRGLDMAGRLAGGTADQRAMDRGVETEFNLLNDRNYNDSMQSRTGQQNTQALQYANARLGAEQARMRQIGGADMLGSSKPPTDSRAILSGAGYMSPETIQMMRQRAMSALESGSDVPQMTEMPTYRDTQMSRPTGGDRALNALRTGSQAYRALRDFGVF